MGDLHFPITRVAARGSSFAKKKEPSESLYFDLFE